MGLDDGFKYLWDVIMKLAFGQNHFYLQLIFFVMFSGDHVGPLEGFGYYWNIYASVAHGRGLKVSS